MKVYPAKATAMALNRTRPPGHPTAGPLNADGSDWPEDGFTFRMLVHGIVTEDQAKAWKGDAPAHTSPRAEWTAWAHKTIADMAAPESERAPWSVHYGPGEPAKPAAPGARDIREPPGGIVTESVPEHSPAKE
jgi:hypothetical protein